MLHCIRKSFPALIFALTCVPAVTYAQNLVTGQLESHDSVKLDVIRIYPDSFPHVAVIFRATSPSGQPLWNLDTSNVKVKENDISCSVKSVRKISNTESVNTALVIDHSGSMLESIEYSRWLDSVQKLPKRWKKVTLRELTHGKSNSDSTVMVPFYPACPVASLPPMEHAKIAAKSYIASIDSSKDKTALIGFSSTVTVSEQLSFKRNEQRRTIDGFEATEGTAFYDAVFHALDVVNQGHGIKAVVAMTDGSDNSSKHSLRQVIKHAKDLSIPVYVVGLGNAEQKVLRKLARETGGDYYYTKDAANLSGIYLSISKRIKAVYELVYQSHSLSSFDSIRNVEISFMIGGEYIKSRQLEVLLPKSVTDFLKAKEDSANVAKQVVVSDNVQQNDSDNDTLPYAAGIAIALVAAGVISAQYIRKKQSQNAIRIVNLYPNPVVGPLTVVLNTDITSLPGQVLITDAKGQIVFTEEFTTGSAKDLNVSHLDNGTYTLSVQAAGNLSSSKMFVVSK